LMGDARLTAKNTWRSPEADWLFGTASRACLLEYLRKADLPTCIRHYCD
jgi:hypothetical protein